ncbi:hypothetical protein CAXC1_90009 [Candidatus Xenohaliotis californiensis]|uniref:Uncharacterized protein n=1 Tax=Candidatus Xenohaliotis californiensis TaxID=84677 RepID=A0ABP0EVK3_9RICK|nr:hypothetical protein CAXC1_90009 [Candidatus Xenohaliotis californiensis]
MNNMQSCNARHFNVKCSECQLGSMVEQLFCKQQVIGSSPIVGIFLNQ